MAVNLINNEQIHVIQDGSDITLDIQADALKNDNVVVGSIRSKNIAREISYKSPTAKYGDVVSATYSLEEGKTYTISFDTTNTNLDIYRQTPGNIGFTSLTPYSLTCDGTRKSFTGIASATATYSNITIFSRLSDKSATPLVISNLQIEEGTTASTYSPYQNLTGEENYSTNEIRIGTWMGKPLYRKTLYFASNGGGTSEVSYTLSNYGIINVDTIFITHPSFYSNNSNGYRHPFQYYDGNKFSCGVNATSLNVTLGYVPISNSPFVITLEYTKTTD